MITTGHEESARRVDNNCKCHLMIDDVSVESQYESVKCKLNVLGSTDPAQIGKTTTEFFKYGGKAAGMILNLLEATGLINAGQRRAAQESGNGVQFEESLLKGKQLCATIRIERKQVKDFATGKYVDDPEDATAYARIGFDTYGVWDQKAAGIPLDMQFAAMVPKPTQAAGAPAPTSPSQNTPPASGTSAQPASGPSMSW